MNYLSIIILVIGIALEIITIFQLINPKTEFYSEGAIGKVPGLINKKENPIQFYSFIILSLIVGALIIIWGVTGLFFN